MSAPESEEQDANGARADHDCAFQKPHAPGLNNPHIGTRLQKVKQAGMANRAIGFAKGRWQLWIRPCESNGVSKPSKKYYCSKRCGRVKCRVLSRPKVPPWSITSSIPSTCASSPNCRQMVESRMLNCPGAQKS